MKIAVIGAGSYVFGPSVLAQAFLEERLDDVELALMDVDAESLEGMAGVGRRMARENGLAGVTVTAHTERGQALDGADYVVCCAAPQLHRRFATDREIVARLYPGHVLTEFGGVAGISYSLRQIAFVTGLAADMRRACPEAPLLTVSNPLPRVVQAAAAEGVRAVGFCSVAVMVHGTLWRLFGRTGPLHYPFAAAREAWDVTTAGLNHLSWVVGFRDRVTGADLLPELRERIAAGATAGNPRAERLCRETGYLLAPADDHTQDFFAPRPGEVRAVEGDAPAHGSAEERLRRLDLLRAIGAGERPWDELLAHEAWEKPLAFAAAHAGRRAPTDFASLNLVNQDSQAPGLPAGVAVETPCRVSPGKIEPARTELPATVLPYCRETAAVTDAIVRAARAKSRALVREAARLDPTITDKDAGIAALDACLEAHADLIGAYA